MSWKIRFVTAGIIRCCAWVFYFFFIAQIIQFYFPSPARKKRQLLQTAVMNCVFSPNGAAWPVSSSLSHPWWITAVCRLVVVVVSVAVAILEGADKEWRPSERVRANSGPCHNHHYPLATGRRRCYLCWMTLLRLRSAEFGMMRLG